MLARAVGRGQASCKPTDRQLNFASVQLPTESCVWGLLVRKKARMYVFYQTLFSEKISVSPNSILYQLNRLPSFKVTLHELIFNPCCTRQR